MSSFSFEHSFGVTPVFYRNMGGGFSEKTRWLLILATVVLGTLCLFWTYTFLLGIALWASLAASVLYPNHPFSSLREYQERRHFQDPITYKVNENGLSQRSRRFCVEASWKALRVWDEQDGWLSLNCAFCPTFWFPVAPLKELGIYELVCAQANRFGVRFNSPEAKRGRSPADSQDTPTTFHLETPGPEFVPTSSQNCNEAKESFSVTHSVKISDKLKNLIGDYSLQVPRLKLLLLTILGLGLLFFPFTLLLGLALLSLVGLSVLAPFIVQIGKRQPYPKFIQTGRTQFSANESRLTLIQEYLRISVSWSLINKWGQRNGWFLLITSSTHGFWFPVKKLKKEAVYEAFIDKVSRYAANFNTKS